MRKSMIFCALLSLVATAAGAAPPASDAQLVQYAIRASSYNRVAHEPGHDATFLKGMDADSKRENMRRRAQRAEARAFYNDMPLETARRRLVPLLARLTPGWGGYESVSYILALKGIETSVNVRRMFASDAPGAGERAPRTPWERANLQAALDEWDIDMLPFRLEDVYLKTHDPAVLRQALSPPILDGSYAVEWPYMVLELTLRDPKGMLGAASGSHALTQRLGSFLFMSDVPKDKREKAAAILREYARGPNPRVTAVARACLAKKPVLEAPGRMFGP